MTAPFYGGALVDENGIETFVMGLDANVLVFSVLTIALLSVFVYALRSERDDRHPRVVIRDRFSPRYPYRFVYNAQLRHKYA